MKAVALALLLVTILALGYLLYTHPQLLWKVTHIPTPKAPSRQSTYTTYGKPQYTFTSSKVGTSTQTTHPNSQTTSTLSRTEATTESTNPTQSSKTSATEGETEELTTTTPHTTIKSPARTETQAPQLPSKVSTAGWEKPPACMSFKRKELTENDVVCALSQWTIFRNITKQLTSRSDPSMTAINVAEWIANHVKYVRDEESFHVEDYVQLPSETYNHRFGDCEDLSLLEAAMLISTGLYKEVLIADISFSNIEVGHVEAGALINGTYALIPWVNATYPMDIFTDYYGYMRTAGANISNITLYVVKKQRNELGVEKIFITHSQLHFTYPPPITDRDMEVLEDSINTILEKEGFNTSSFPPYMRKLWRTYLSQYIPDKAPPLPITGGYYVIYLPVDWYSNKSSEWIAWRVRLRLSPYLPSLRVWGAKYGYSCTYAYVKEEYTTLDAPLFTSEGTYVRVKKNLPSIAIVFLATPYCNPPATTLSIKDDEATLTIEVPNNSNIQVLIYGNSSNPVLGITRKGWTYKQIPYIIADEWSFGKGGVTIRFSIKEISSRLPQGTYEVVVWFDGKVAYEDILKVST